MIIITIAKNELNLPCIRCSEVYGEDVRGTSSTTTDFVQIFKRLAKAINVESATADHVEYLILMQVFLKAYIFLYTLYGFLEIVGLISESKHGENR